MPSMDRQTRRATGAIAHAEGMNLGAILVLVGILLVVIDFALGHIHNARAVSGLLHAGVVLIGIGVLVGSTQLSTH